jgi:glucosamine 6-phosphate synthetase-like amidotransferase/phosphosugar isomerase protein
VAASLEQNGLVCIIGGGPNYATALFGMAKFIETAAYPAVGQELEEWAHEQYFCTRSGTTTFVLAPSGASVDRAREQLQAVRDMQGRGIAICPVEDTETADLTDVVLPVQLPSDELLSPLVTPLPLELVALAFAQRLGRTMLGFDDDRRRAVNFRQIFGSTDPLETPGSSAERGISPERPAAELRSTDMPRGAEMDVDASLSAAPLGASGGQHAPSI